MGNNKRSEDSNFVIQGTILAAAAIVSRVIGMLYRIPLTNIIGDEGNGLYAVAYEVYSIALLLSSYSLPLAVSKLVAARVGDGQKRNAFQIFKAAIIFAFIAGLVSSIVVFFGAEFITKTILNSPMSAFALKILSPTLFLVAMMGVIRGYFQGLGTMIPTAVSQIIEQVINAIVSVVAAMQLYEAGRKLGEVTGNKSTAAAYGAGGGAVGPGVGAVVGLVFLIIVLSGYGKVLKKQIKRDITIKREGYSQIYRLLIWTIIPVVLSTAIYNISTVIDQGIFNSVLKGQGIPYKEYTSLYGIFSGKYKILISVPVSIASAVASSVIPGLTIATNKNDYHAMEVKINTAIRFTMVITIPCAVGFTVLASPILQFIWGDARTLPANLMIVGSSAVVFYALSTLTNGILQGLGKMRLPVRNAAVSLVIHIAALYIMLKVFKLQVYGVVLAYIVFAVPMCILNAVAIRKTFKYKQEIKRTFLIPCFAAAVMGICVFAVHLLLKGITGNKIAVVISIFLGALIYAVLLFLFKEFEREELLAMPKGHLIVKLADKFHLL